MTISKFFRFLISAPATLVLMLAAIVLYKMPKCKTAHANVCAANWEIHDFIERG